MRRKSNRQGHRFEACGKGSTCCSSLLLNEDAAKSTLAKIREFGSDGFLVQADVCRPREISRIFQQVEAEFRKLDILVSNARTEVPTFYQEPMEITLDKQRYRVPHIRRSPQATHPCASHGFSVLNSLPAAQ